MRLRQAQCLAFLSGDPLNYEFAGNVEQSQMHILSRSADSLERRVGRKHENLREANYMFDRLAGVKHFIDPVVHQHRKPPGITADAVAERVASRTPGDFYQVIDVLLELYHREAQSRTWHHPGSPPARLESCRH